MHTSPTFLHRHVQFLNGSTQVFHIFAPGGGQAPARGFVGAFGPVCAHELACSVAGGAAAASGTAPPERGRPLVYLAMAQRSSDLVRRFVLPQIVDKLKVGLGVPTLRVALPGGSAVSKDKAAGDKLNIKTVAVCAGSGAGVFRKLSDPVDLVVTGELSHHEVLALNDQGTTVLLAEHTNTERGFLATVASEMRADLAGTEVVLSSHDADPLTVW